MAAAQHELDAPPWKRVESTLMATARAIRRAFNARYAELDLNVTQASLLAYLDERGPLSQTQLADALGMGRAATGLVITALKKRELISRRANPLDRRTWEIALRPEGESLIAPIHEIDRILRSELRTGISRAERQQLAALLLRLQSNLGRVFEQPGAE
jgi:MarR family transcriptional regulator for hemolysin